MGDISGSAALLLENEKGLPLLAEVWPKLRKRAHTFLFLLYTPAELYDPGGCARAGIL